MADPVADNVTVPRDEYDRLLRIAEEASVVAEDIEYWRSADDENPVPWPLVALQGDLLRAALDGAPRPDLEASLYRV